MNLLGIVLKARRKTIRVGTSRLLCLLLLAAASAGAQTQALPSPSSDISQSAVTHDPAIAQLEEQLRAQEAQLKELEAKLARLKLGQPPAPNGVVEPASAGAPASPPASDDATAPAQTTPSPAAEVPATPVAQTEPEMGTPGHNMAIPGGPVMNIRGFFDFNFGAGSIANPLVFPIVDNGCGTCGNPVPRRRTPHFRPASSIYSSRPSFPIT